MDVAFGNAAAGTTKWTQNTCDSKCLSETMVYEGADLVYFGAGGPVASEGDEGPWAADFAEAASRGNVAVM